MSTAATNTTSKTAAARLIEGDGLDYLADGGLETTLLFLAGVDLPDFAAFPLLDDPEGRRHLSAYAEPYLDAAAAHGLGIVLDTPTWRANLDWATRLGYDAEALAAVNRRAVAFVREAAAQRPEVDSVVNGAIGPRGDGYVVGEAMSVAEATNYHSLQAKAFAEAGADIITALTMTYIDEAIGVVHAAQEVGLPVVIGFTVETDGRLPSGMSLGEAITAVDAASDSGPIWYMINCAHPSHFASVLEGPWLSRVRSIRANASRMSHAELDEAPELDRGDVDELAADYLDLWKALPNLRVVGGCCGTDHEHVASIADAVSADRQMP